METTLTFAGACIIVPSRILEAVDPYCCSNWQPGWYHLTRPPHVRPIDPPFQDLRIVGPFPTETEARAYR